MATAADTAIDDPSRRLSGEAQQRIRDAYDQAERAILRVVAQIKIQHQSEHGLLPGELAPIGEDFKTRVSMMEVRLSFEDYCVKNSSAAVGLGDARLKAALIVGRAILGELSAFASGRECWTFVQGPSGLSSHLREEFRLSETQRELLWLELKIDPGFEGITKPPKGTAAEPPETVADANSANVRARQIIDDRHCHHLKLFDQVLEKISLDDWISLNRGLSRTQVTDYRAGRIARRVGNNKRVAIEAAILRSHAEQFGLPNSD